MFTGIVAAVGSISRVEPAKGGLRLAIDAGRLGLRDVAVGDSITVNGACLTVVKRGKKSFSVDVSRETLRVHRGPRPAKARSTSRRRCRLSDRLDGHLVLGHVDGVGKVTKVERRGANRLLRVRVPASLARYIAAQGLDRGATA